jgi:protein translocase, SecG subunit
MYPPKPGPIRTKSREYRATASHREDLYIQADSCQCARRMSVLIPILMTFHLLVCVLMVGAVLMQRPKNEGLGAAFGGGMTDNIFGAQTTHVLQKFTVWLGIVFFALTLVLAVIYAKRGTGETSIQKELLGQPVPQAVTPAAPATSATGAAPVVVTTEPVSIEEVVTEASEAPAAAPAGN